MNLKINTIANRIQLGLIDSKALKNMQDFALKEDMLLHSIPLKDGTAAKILANAIEYDCLIMKNGKVLTAKGKVGTTDEVATGILGLFEHILKRRRAAENIDVDKESYVFIDDYLNKYEDLMTKI